jgi:hypothetical protein
MIERAIENWLINTNERNYQVPFRQVLLHKGHRVFYLSSHRPMEQGKDIITIDPNGNYCAYQLKTGDVDLTKWRIILGEIKELIELPIVHSSFDKNKIHNAYLVTNGEITDEVRIQIDQINDDNQRKKRGYAYLDVISGQILLKDFLDAQGEFIPKELEDFHLFLELNLSDGIDFLPKEKYFNFFYKTIFKDTTKQKSDAINAISSSIILASYLLNPYQLKKNFYALFEGWVSLAGYIVQYANKIGLKREDFNESMNLVFSEIIRNLFMLKDETLKREDFLEGDLHGDGGLIYKARVTIVLGGLAALETYLHSEDEKYVLDRKLLELIKQNIQFIWFWGESAFPYFFSLIKYLELNNEGKIAKDLLNGIFLFILNINSPRKNIGIPSPYYSVSDIFEVIFKIDAKKIDFSQFSGGSYTLGPIILMLARRGERELLEKNWRKLSHIQLKEFKPDNIEDTFLWCTDSGSNQTEFPKATQSWACLVKEASDLGEVPELYEEYSNLLHFFILVCPHRVNKQTIIVLDQNR